MAQDEQTNDDSKAKEGAKEEATTRFDSLPNVFTMSKTVEIHDSLDLGTRLLNKAETWVTAGLDYPITNKKRVKFTAKMLIPRKSDNRVYFCVGFASKGVVNTHGSPFCNFRDSVAFHSDGHVYTRPVLPWIVNLALEQDITVECCDYSFVFYVNDEQVHTLSNTKELNGMKKRNVELYPAISWHGDGALMQVVGLQVLDK